MRVSKIIPAILCVWCIASAEPSTASLSGPDEVSLSGSVYSFYKVPFELEIRWQEDDPLELDLYLSEGRLKAGGHFVTFSFKDSSGEKADMGDIIGSYAPSQGEIRVFKGQNIIIGLTGHGWANVEFGKKYMLTVILYGRIKDQSVSIEGRKEVVFVKISATQGQDKTAD